MFFCRSKFCNRYFKSVMQLRFRFYTVPSSPTIDLFVKMLGIKQSDAEIYVYKHGINSVEPSRLLSTIKFFEDVNYMRHELLLYPQLFKSCMNTTWEQYYLVLKESGFTDVSLKNLTHFRLIINCTVRDLKKNDYIDKNVNVASYIKQSLNPQYEIEIDDLTNNCTLSHIHNKILYRFLELRLDATSEQMEKVMKTHKYIYNKSIRNICENIDIALELGYTKKKILNNGYILQVLPKHTKEVIAMLPDFAGTDIKKQMLIYPKLIGIPWIRLLGIYEILKKYQIQDSVIAKYMNIFTLSQTTIEERLEEISKMPEIKGLMNHPKILKILVHYNRARTRLSFLEQIQFKCASLLVLGSDGNKFDNHVKNGDDLNAVKELNIFLINLLLPKTKYMADILNNEDMTENVINHEINNGSDGTNGTAIKQRSRSRTCRAAALEERMRRHPHRLRIPFVNMRRTYRYLIAKGYKNRDIEDSPFILLYPVCKVNYAFKKLREAQMEKRYDKNLKPRDELNIVLYFLEKDNHFNGNGVWNEIPK